MNLILVALNIFSVVKKNNKMWLNVFGTFKSRKSKNERGGVHLKTHFYEENKDVDF